jgi:hypothetical protein
MSARFSDFIVVNLTHSILELCETLTTMRPAQAVQVLPGSRVPDRAYGTDGVRFLPRISCRLAYPDTSPSRRMLPSTFSCSSPGHWQRMMK